MADDVFAMFSPPPGDADLAAQVEDYLRDPEWPYDYIEAGGEKWKVRRPKPEALRAFSAAVSKHAKVDDATRNDMIGLFVRQHCSEATFEYMMYRMMDPDDDGLTLKMFGEIMRKIATLGTARPTAPSSH